MTDGALSRSYGQQNRELDFSEEAKVLYSRPIMRHYFLHL
jgi:hypothetical protein